MHRESDQHGPRQDDELKHEMRGMLQGNGPSHAEEWRETETPIDDELDIPPMDEPPQR